MSSCCTPVCFPGNPKKGLCSQPPQVKLDPTTRMGAACAASKNRNAPEGCLPLFSMNYSSGRSE